MPTYNNGAGYFLYVNDISEVYGYNVPSGGTMFFMNRNQPVLYLKSVNMFNQQTVTEYALIERTVPDSQAQHQIQPVSKRENQNDYVTRGEITSIIAETLRNELRNNRDYKNNRKEEQG